jgi:cell division protease FtsH
MSEAIGPVAIGKKEESIFLGREMHQSAQVSQKTAELVDNEVRKFITSNYDRAKKLLEKNIKILHKMAEALLERETLDKDEIDSLMHNKPLPAFIGQKDKKTKSVSPMPAAKVA